MTTEVPTAHARLSPSSSKRWFACPGSIVLEAAYPNESNEFSDEGTACHEVAAWCLRNAGHGAHERVGEYIVVSHEPEPERTVKFTDDMADMVQAEVETVRKLADGAQLLLTEQRVDFSKIIGVDNSFGTLDVGIITADGELQVRDFKFGHTPVEVEENTQLLIYALAAYEELSLSFDITGIRLAIHQPKVAGVTEWTSSVEYLTGVFKTRLKKAVERVQEATQMHAVAGSDDARASWASFYLHPNPNEQDCAFCRAKADCPAAARKLQETVGAAFDAIAPVEATAYEDADLAAKMASVGFVEDWCKAVRAECERRLLAGQEVPGFGLELGRKGARKFDKPQAAEDLLRKKFRLKIEYVYDMSLKSPTQLEKLTKPVKTVDDLSGLETTVPAPLSDRQWKQLQALVVQADPKPSVKPASAIKTPYTIPKPDDSAFKEVS